MIVEEVFRCKTGHMYAFDIFLVYDKQLEPVTQTIPTGTIDNLFELKNDRAVSVSKMLTSGISLPDVFRALLGYLKHQSFLFILRIPFLILWIYLR